MKFQARVLNKAIRQELSATEAVDFYMIENLFAKSFRLSKEGHPLLSAYYLNLGEKLLHAIPAEGALKPWLMTVYYPKKSYFLFKEKKHEEAIKLVEANITLLRKLVQRQHDFLCFVIIQQAHNLARVYMAQANKQQALCIIKADLLFLLTGTCETSYLQGLTLSRFRDAFPSEAAIVINMFINQLLHDALLSVLKNTTHSVLVECLDFLFSSEIRSAVSTYTTGSQDAIVTKKMFQLFMPIVDGAPVGQVIEQVASFKRTEPRLTSAQENVLNHYVSFLSSQPERLWLDAQAGC